MNKPKSLFLKSLIRLIITYSISYSVSAGVHSLSITYCVNEPVTPDVPQSYQFTWNNNYCVSASPPEDHLKTSVKVVSKNNGMTCEDGGTLWVDFWSIIPDCQITSSFIYFYAQGVDGTGKSGAIPVFWNKGAVGSWQDVHTHGRTDNLEMCLSAGDCHSGSAGDDYGFYYNPDLDQRLYVILFPDGK